MSFRKQEMKGDTANSGAELELKLNLSFPAAAKSSSSTDQSSLESSNASSEMSCVSSSEANNNNNKNKKEETKPMVLVGCLGCLMYVLLSGADPNPKCPNCNSRVLLDILKNEEQNNNNNNNNKKKKPIP